MFLPPEELRPGDVVAFLPRTGDELVSVGPYGCSLWWCTKLWSTLDASIEEGWLKSLNHFSFSEIISDLQRRFVCFDAYSAVGFGSNGLVLSVVKRRIGACVITWTFILWGGYGVAWMLEPVNLWLLQ